jgi:hypothetical protein
MVLVLAYSAVVGAPAFAEFARRPLAVWPGPPGKDFATPTGVAVGGPGHVGEPGHVWVTDLRGGDIDEFSEPGVFEREIPDTGHFPEGGPEALATDAAAEGPLYLFGNSGPNATRNIDIFEDAGTFLEEWGPFFGSEHAAVDNATGSDGDVYVAETESHVVKLFDAGKKPLSFKSSGKVSYIHENELTGVPGESFGFESPSAIATDSLGDIFVVDRGHEGGGVVDEFNAEGVFVRVFAGPEDAKAAISEVAGALQRFGTDSIEAVTVDPGSGDVLIGENHFSPAGGVVYEFAADGHFLNRVASDPPGGSLGSADGLAVGEDEDLYVADGQDHVVDVFGPGVYLPGLAIGAASDREPTSVTLNATVDPEGIAITECYFEYVTEAAFAGGGFSDSKTALCEEPAAGEIGSDNTVHAVHATVTGLTSGTTYHFRLVATNNPADDGGSNESQSTTFTAPHAPAVDATSVTNLSSTFADFRAEINPLGSDTSYRFEYVAAANYHSEAQDPYGEGVSIPEVPSDIGSSGSDASVLQQVGGLRPDTEYDLRVVASNALGTTFGANESFTTLPVGTGGLLERGYEMLTPPNKGDAEDMFGAADDQNFDVGYAAEDGNSFLLYTTAAFGPFPASGENGYVFSRGEDGWSFTSLAARDLGVQSLAVTPELSSFSRVAIHDSVGSGGREAELQEVNQIGPPGGPYTTVSTTPDAGGANHVVGGAADLDTLVLARHCQARESGSCYSGQDDGTDALFEWKAGESKLVDVDSSGSPVSRCGAILGQEDGAPGATHDAVSADGSKIFFTAPDPLGSGSGCWKGGTSNPPELYMRLDGKATVELSAPNKEVDQTKGLGAAVYVGAAANGSKVFFISESELTKDDEGISDPELYEYDTETETLTRVSRGESGKEAGDVLYVPAVSADGSAVYFTAFGKLTANAPPSGGGSVDLYRYDTDSGTTTYVATVEESDYPSDVADRWWSLSTGKGELGLDPAANWYTTPDGRYLVFASRADLTGYDTSAASSAECPGVDGAAPNGHCTEVYRYDSADGSLACVSCDPSGAAPTSNAQFARSAVRIDSPGGPPRGISDDGNYVFFDTGDALVPQDTNGKLDVYEWHDGAVSLISSGADSDDSFFLDASPDGSNVFFGTHAQLVAKDTDSEGDLYDARIGGGEPIETGFGPFEGDACQTPQLPPIDLTPASLTFSGLVANPTVAPVAQTTTRAGKLARALKACRKSTRKRRTDCEARARKRYGAKARKGKAKIGSRTSARRSG